MVLEGVLGVSDLTVSVDWCCKAAGHYLLMKRSKGKSNVPQSEAAQIERRGRTCSRP